MSNSKILKFDGNFICVFLEAKDIRVILHKYLLEPINQLKNTHENKSEKFLLVLDENDNVLATCNA